MRRTLLSLASDATLFIKTQEKDQAKDSENMGDLYVRRQSNKQKSVSKDTDGLYAHTANKAFRQWKDLHSLQQQASEETKIAYSCTVEHAIAQKLRQLKVIMNHT